jgi:hypothetical protein
MSIIASAFAVRHVDEGMRLPVAEGLDHVREVGREPWR